MDTNNSSFEDFCRAKYGDGVRKTVYLAAVWRAAVVEGRSGKELHARIDALRRYFAAYAKKRGIKAARENPPLWKLAAEYFGRIGK